MRSICLERGVLCKFCPFFCSFGLSFPNVVGTLFPAIGTAPVRADFALSGIEASAPSPRTFAHTLSPKFGEHPDLFYDLNALNRAEVDENLAAFFSPHNHRQRFGEGGSDYYGFSVCKPETRRVLRDGRYCALEAKLAFQNNPYSLSNMPLKKLEYCRVNG